VRKPRTQILIENYRANPNGVRNQFLSLPEDVQMNILQEIAEDFPPSRTGDPISNVGMELYQFLTEGDGIADSPTRREVLMRDNQDAMRPGPSSSRGDSFVTKESSDGPLGVTGDERGDQLTELDLEGYVDNPEATGIVDNSPPDNPQNRYSKAAKDSSALGYTKQRLGEQESFRGNERFADVEDGQPTNKAIPGTGRMSDSADMEVSPAGQQYAQGQIGKNADTRYADMVAEKDNSSYFDSYQEGIVGMMNNSRNPDALGGNRIDQLWGLISKTGDDPRTMFGSAEAMADVMLGYVNPKMVDNMTNPSPIGQQLPAGQRSQMSYDLIKEQLVKQINQKYGDGFGSASAADLNKADTLAPDGVNDLDAELDAVTPVDDLGDVPEPQAGRTDYRDRYDPIGPREEPSGAPPGSARDRMMQAERNQQERFDLYQERLDELMNEEGLTVEEAVEMMEYEGMGPDFLQTGLDDVGRVQRFGMPRENDGLGFSRYGNKGPKKPGPPLSVKAAKEKKIGAKGPQKTAEEAPHLRDNGRSLTGDEKKRISQGKAHMDGGEVVDGPPPKDIYDDPDNVAINERANITRENEGKAAAGKEATDTQDLEWAERTLTDDGYTEDDINTLRSVGGNEAVIEQADVVARKGDLDTTGEGRPIDSNESAATDLPDDTKPKDTKPKPDDTKPKETEPKETEPKETKPKETKPKPDDTKPKPKDTWRDNIVTRNPGRITAGAAALGAGAMMFGGTKTVNAPPDGSMAPAGDGSGGATPSELPTGMAPNGGFEKDEDGVLTDAGLAALLERSKRRIRSRPSINTGTQTMGNWVR
jgi:hypothetical protein